MNKKLNLDNTIEISKVLYTNNVFGYITLAYSSFNESNIGKTIEFTYLRPHLTRFLNIVGRDAKRINKLNFTYIYVVEKTNRDVLSVGIWNNLKCNEETILRYKKLWSSIIGGSHNEEFLDYFHYHRLSFSNRIEFTDFAIRRLLGRDLNPLYFGVSENLFFFVDPNNNPEDTY